MFGAQEESPCSQNRERVEQKRAEHNTDGEP